MESPCIIKMPRDGETPPRAHAAVKAPTASWFARESRKGRTFDLDIGSVRTDPTTLHQTCVCVCVNVCECIYVCM